MIYKVNLALFEDDANGEYGLAHKNATDRGFNAFWTHQGIFHDVFEHYFEDIHPYFQGEYAFNVGGEVAAMGHLVYYENQIGLENRWFNRYSMYGRDRDIVETTRGEMYEAINQGFCNFGNELLCKVPYQKVSDVCIEDIIDIHMSGINLIPVEGYEEQAKEVGRNYKKSITRAKLQRLYRWGYERAKGMFPRTNHNIDKLYDFLEVWKDITEKNKPKELHDYGIIEFEFTIKTGEEMNWKCEAITSERQRLEIKNAYITDLLLDLNFDE